MPLSGYTTHLPTDALLNNGIVMAGASKWGATKGGVRFDPAREIENLEFDGKQADVKGLDRMFYGKSKIMFTGIELGDASTGAQLSKIEPGSTAASAGSPNVTTITPLAGGTIISSGSYLTDFRAIFERAAQSGTKRYATVYFPSALCTKYEIVGSDQRGNAIVNVEVEARRDMASGNIEDAPYRVELREALPS